MKRRSFLLRVGLLAVYAQCQEVRDLHPQEGDFVLRDFHFRSGESLPELRLHYATLGTPVRDAHGAVQNAVIILHGTTGSGKAISRRRSCRSTAPASRWT